MPDLMPFILPLLSFLAATIVGLGMSVVAFRFARKAGLDTIQANLVSTLKDTVAVMSARQDSQDEAIEDLKAQLVREQTDKSVLKATVERLRNTVTDLATENAELRRKLHMPESRIEVS